MSYPTASKFSTVKNSNETLNKNFGLKSSRENPSDGSSFSPRLVKHFVEKQKMQNATAKNLFHPPQQQQ